jgi:hypothetical protein
MGQSEGEDLRRLTADTGGRELSSCVKLRHVHVPGREAEAEAAAAQEAEASTGAAVTYPPRA